MTTEELTAEERAKLSTRVIHCYDAALARAEEAETQQAVLQSALDQARKESGTMVTLYDMTNDDKLAAESALAEATALLEEASNCMGLDAVDMCERISAFLSRTPAPAATAEPTLLERIEAVVNVGQCVCCVHLRHLIRASKKGGAL